MIDVQVGFDDPFWGPRNNPDADANIDLLVREFTRQGHLVVYVRHDSDDPASPLHPRSAGNRLKPYLQWRHPDLSVSKTVNSAFHGTPDLHAWLTERDVSDLVIAESGRNDPQVLRPTAVGGLGHDAAWADDFHHALRTLLTDEPARLAMGRRARARPR